MPYLKKILTPAEIELVRAAENSDLTLWSLWACKETAYKVARKSDAGAAFLPRQWSVVHAGSAWGKGKVIIPGKDPVFVQCFASGSYVHCIGSDNIHDLDKIIWHVDPVPENGKNADPSLFVREQLLRQLADTYSLNFAHLEIRRLKKGGDLQPPCVYLTNEKAPFDISLSHDGRFAAYAFLKQSN